MLFGEATQSPVLSRAATPRLDLVASSYAVANRIMRSGRASHFAKGVDHHRHEIDSVLAADLCPLFNLARVRLPYRCFHRTCSTRAHRQEDNQGMTPAIASRLTLGQPNVLEDHLWCQGGALVHPAKSAEKGSGRPRDRRRGQGVTTSSTEGRTPDGPRSVRPGSRRASTQSRVAQSRRRSSEPIQVRRRASSSLRTEWQERPQSIRTRAQEFSVCAGERSAHSRAASATTTTRSPSAITRFARLRKSSGLDA